MDFMSLGKLDEIVQKSDSVDPDTLKKAMEKSLFQGKEKSGTSCSIAEKRDEKETKNVNGSLKATEKAEMNKEITMIAKQPVLSGLCRSEIVQSLVDRVFEQYSLTSADCSFFGNIASSIIPMGYYLQKIGSHRFFVKSGCAVNVSLLLSFMNKAMNLLKNQDVVQFPLVYRKEIEGAILWWLYLTEEELREIIRSFPQYRIGYADIDGDIGDIKLTIKQKEALKIGRY